MMCVLIGSWLVAASLAGAVLFWRARTSGPRVLIGWLAIHLAALTLAGSLTPRQLAIPAVPAALLTAWALHALAGRVARGAPKALGAAIYRGVPAAVVLLLVYAAGMDHRTALRLNVRAGDAARALVQRIKAVAPPGREQVDLMLVNMPGLMTERDMYAWAFSNGLQELAWAASPAVGTVELRQMPGWGPPDVVPERFRRLTPDALRAHLADRYLVLLLFEAEPFGVRRMTAQDIDRFAVAPAPR
jgi:hypothetical protein